MAKNIQIRRVMLNDASQIPSDLSSTPGGTMFSTTPGGRVAAGDETCSSFGWIIADVQQSGRAASIPFMREICKFLLSILDLAVRTAESDTSCYNEFTGITKECSIIKSAASPSANNRHGQKLKSASALLNRSRIYDLSQNI